MVEQDSDETAFDHLGHCDSACLGSKVKEYNLYMTN